MSASFVSLKLIVMLLFTIACFGMTMISVAMVGGYTSLPSSQIDYSKGLISASELNSLVDQQLNQMLIDMPDVSTIRLVQIRQGAINKHIVPFLRYAGTNMVSRSNASPMAVAPLSAWKDFLPQLIDDKCVTLKTKDASELIRERLSLARTEISLICPLNAQGYLFGALFLAWRATDKFNTSSDLVIAQKYAAKITAYLEIAVRE